MSRAECNVSSIEVSTVAAIEAAKERLERYEASQIDDKLEWADRYILEMRESNKGLLRRLGILKKFTIPSQLEVIAAMDSIYGGTQFSRQERQQMAEFNLLHRIDEFGDMALAMMYYEFKNGDNIRKLRSIAGMDQSKIAAGIIASKIILSIDDARFIGVI